MSDNAGNSVKFLIIVYGSLFPFFSLNPDT
jgi:hypothetical protein